MTRFNVLSLTFQSHKGFVLRLSSPRYSHDIYTKSFVCDYGMEIMPE